MVASIELQKAVYSVLSQSHNVYEAVPSGASMPYIVIGEEVLTDGKTKTEGKTKHLLTLHTWSDSQSSGENKTLMDFVRKSIDYGLPVSGYVVDFVRLEMTQSFKEAVQDKYIFHGVVQIEITLMEG